MTAELRRQWSLLLPGQSLLGDELLERWSEPHRSYHDLGHLAETLAAIARLGAAGRAEHLALWFHDAVHTGSPGADEQASARLAQTRLSAAGLDATECRDVARLVLVTIDHRPQPDDHAGARVSDADLAVLGSDERRYAESVAALRAEAPGLSDADWRALRLARVSRLLATEQLFHTPTGRDLWRRQAMANLAAERECLRRSGAGPNP